MLDPLLLGLLVAAIAIGWWLGRRERRRARERLSPEVSLPRDYFIGLNHLLNEKPDQAIETFVQALEVNSDTIETHMRWVTCSVHAVKPTAPSRSIKIYWRVRRLPPIKAVSCNWNCRGIS